jgi:hypothetical protein
MKKQALLFALTAFLITSCGNYHNKIRYSKSRKQTKKEVVEESPRISINDEVEEEQPEELELVIVEEKQEYEYTEVISEEYEMEEETTSMEEPVESTFVDQLVEQNMPEEIESETEKEEDPEMDYDERMNPFALAGFLSSISLLAILGTQFLFYFYIPYAGAIFTALFIAGIVLSIVGIVDIKNGGAQRGMGLAISGLVIPLVLIVIGLLILLFLLLIFGF